jgi:hypothetical protein
MQKNMFVDFAEAFRNFLGLRAVLRVSPSPNYGAISR